MVFCGGVLCLLMRETHKGSSDATRRIGSLSVHWNRSRRGRRNRFALRSLDDERGVREDSEFFGVSLAEDVDFLSSASTSSLHRRDRDPESTGLSEEEEDEKPEEELLHAAEPRRTKRGFLMRSRAAKPDRRDALASPEGATAPGLWGDAETSLEEEAWRRRRERSARGWSEAEKEAWPHRREEEAAGRFKVGDTSPGVSLPEFYYHNMPLPKGPPDNPDDPLPFPLDFISEEEKQDIRRMPTKEEREADRRDYFGADNVRAYHLYNPHWTPFQESNDRPSHNLEATAVGDFGQSPRRPMRESDMAQPSVPFGWRVYAAICLAKLPFLLADYEARVEALLGKEKKHFQEQTLWQQLDRQPEALAGPRPRLPLPHPPYHVWETSIHPRLQLPFIVWARLSARLCNSSAKMLELFRLVSLEKEKRESRFAFQRTGKGMALGDYFVFAAPTLHHAVRFLESNPKHKAGVYREGHLYELTDATAEHVLLGKGERRSAERDEIYLSLGFYVPPPPRAPWPNPKESETERGNATASEALLQSSSSSSSPASSSASSSSPPSLSSSSHAVSVAPEASSVRFSPSASSSAEVGRSPALTLLQEKQLRFLCRSNCVERRSFLFFPRPDSPDSLLLPPEQLLPMTPEQNANVFQRWRRRGAKARVAVAAAKAVVKILKQCDVSRVENLSGNLARDLESWRALQEALRQSAASSSRDESLESSPQPSPSALSSQSSESLSLHFSSLEDERARFVFSVVQRVVEETLNSQPFWASQGCGKSGDAAGGSLHVDGKASQRKASKESEMFRQKNDVETSPADAEHSAQTRAASAPLEKSPEGEEDSSARSDKGAPTVDSTVDPPQKREKEKVHEQEGAVEKDRGDPGQSAGSRGLSRRRENRFLEEHAKENFDISVSAAAAFVLGLVAGDDGRGGSLAVAREVAKLGMKNASEEQDSTEETERTTRSKCDTNEALNSSSQPWNETEAKHETRIPPLSSSRSSSSSLASSPPSVSSPASVFSALKSAAASAVSAHLAEERERSASRAVHLRSFQNAPSWENPHSPLMTEKEAAVESLLFFAEDDEEARDFCRRLPYTRAGVYRSLFLAHAVKVDFYGKAREMVMPNPRHTKLEDEDELEVDEEAMCVEKVDLADWIIRNKLNVTEDAAHDLDKPFYQDYLKDWAYLHLPEGQYLSEPFHATGQDETGDIPDPPLMTALAANREEEHARDYRPGVWLYKPETKILYNDTDTGGLLIGSGFDGTFSWEKPVSNATMTRALILMEMAAEHVRKGHFTWTDDHWSATSKRPNLETHLSQEEEARVKWGLEDFDLHPDDLDPGDHVPSGMEYLNPQLLKSRSPEYQRLVEDPDVAHNVHQDWLARVDRGEATLNEDPFRLSPEQIDLREKFKNLKDLDDEDLPDVSLWRDEGE
ncbi:UNVERIFIED_CONTAM: hypothetical protein HHA_247680 [Hammondia hammondi]|eukprot:XP_008883805.1 hypothetical protein HHA_247680 [Hammondia hammondi]